MLKNEDLEKELLYLEEVRKSLDSDEVKAELKAFRLIIKLLHDIRTNMVTVMRHQGIELVKPKTLTDEESKEQNKRK